MVFWVCRSAKRTSKKLLIPLESLDVSEKARRSTPMQISAAAGSLEPATKNLPVLSALSMRASGKGSSESPAAAFKSAGNNVEWW